MRSGSSHTALGGVLFHFFCVDTLIVQHKENVEDKDKLISVCEDEKKSLTKEIKKQKRGKWIAIIGGIGGVFLTTLIATL